MALKIIKHAYMDPEISDGERILVTRYWLRGLKRENVDTWVKELAPSENLLNDYNAFKKGEPTEEALEKFHAEWIGRYRDEMELQEPLIKTIRVKHQAGETITLLCTCHDPKFCHRTTLKELIEGEDT